MADDPNGGGAAGEAPGPGSRAPTVTTRLPRLPGRVGLVLISPVRALRNLDAFGGGVRDALWLVLAGVLCFRLEAVMRALLGITHLSLGTVLRQMLAVLSVELQGAVLLVLPAAVLVTVLAGRGRRDPSRDLELAAAAYVPFFTVRSIYRAADLDALFGPLPVLANQIASGAAYLWAAVLVLLAVRVARARPEATATSNPGTGEMPARVLVSNPRLPDRLAAAGVGALLGAALFVNLGWVLRHADAIRPLVRGKEAPAFTLPRADGQGDLSLTSLRGQVVLLDFWATWCAPCLHMLPTLEALHTQFRPRGVTFVGVNSDGPGASPEELQVFLQKHKVSYPVVMDQDGEVGGRYKVVALPHMVLVGRDGGIRKTFWGFTSRDELSEALTAAVGE